MWVREQVWVKCRYHVGRKTIFNPASPTAVQMESYLCTRHKGLCREWRLTPRIFKLMFLSRALRKIFESKRKLLETGKNLHGKELHYS